MATESNANAIADFDIDEVIDWDKHDIPTKDIEFDQLQGLNVQVSNVASSTTQASSANTLNSSGIADGLDVLGSQLLASHRDPGTAIVSMPQVPQSSAINPVFPGDPNSLICDIRQEYFHAQNLTARSRTPPTPTFPSENFDLPPITPTVSTFSLGQQHLRMALLSNLNRPATVQSQLRPFVPPTLPPAMSQQLPSVVSDPLVEGSNIEELIDEIVERDMPQGFSEPIVFAPRVSQQPNPPTAHLQIASNALQKGISPVSVRAASPGQLVAAPTGATGKTQLPMGGVIGGSPLNAGGSPGSPLASSRSPSPKLKQTNHTGKVSAPMRSANQGMRLTQPVIQPGSPLQSTPQSAVTNTRSFPSMTSQVMSSNSQMLQMAVPSAVTSAKSQTGSCQPRTPSNLQVKNIVEAVIVNPQGPRVTLPVSTAQSSAPHIPGQNIAAASKKVTSQNLLRGTNISAITLQSSGKPIQTIPIQTLASNPEFLSQLVKAIGQPNAKQQGSAANIQTGQPLICYVLPQNSAPGVQSSQIKSSVPLSSSAHPVKMILLNTNSPVKPQVSLKPQLAKTGTTNPAIAGLNCKAAVSSSQSSETKTGLETTITPSFKQLPTSAGSVNLSMSGVKSDAIIAGNNATPSAHLSAAVNNYQIPISIPTPMLQPSRKLIANNPNSTQISTALGSAQLNSVPLLQTPLPSGGNVVQITFVNEATAISQVVAASSSATLTSSSSGGSQSMVAASQSSMIIPSSLPSSSSSSHMLVAPTTEPATSADQQNTDEDDEDDSKPLSQVAENLKKVSGPDDVKKKKKKKKDKDKGTKRKRKEKDIANKPLTAYELFFKETQAAVRTKNPLAQFEDIKKIVDQMWETLNENLRKAFQEKAQQLENEYRAKKLSQQDEPSPKQKKVETTDAAAATASSTVAGPVTVEPGSSDIVALASNKPLSRAPTQIAMAGKPVATVPPMAASKTTSNTNIQPTITAKPKKSKVTVHPISQRICVCDGCNNPARTTKERGTQYCSNECIVKHCRLAFTVWVTERNDKSEANG